MFTILLRKSTISHNNITYFKVFAVCGVWSLIIPRSGTLVDFVANVLVIHIVFNY